MKEVFIYDMIGGMGVSAKSIIEQLEDGVDVDLRINSVGGDVFEGIAIYNALKKHNGKVNVTIEGLSASMASIIMLAGDEITASANSLIMIHNPQVGVQGDSADLQNKVELLNKIKEQMLNVYTDKTGMQAEEIAVMMDKETWLTAEEALEIGMIDKVGDTIKLAAHFDISNFNAPNWVEEKYSKEEELEISNNQNKEMDKLFNMLSELKETVSNFVTNNPEDNNSEEVSALNDTAIKNQIVDLTEKIHEQEEKWSTVNAELETATGLMITMEENIETLEAEKNSLQTEINKSNATPTTAEDTSDPVVESTDLPKEKSSFEQAADLLGSDSVFRFNKKK
jgi:ATP-dependent Clp endopeptidase proteolytic subunit ClpP